MTVTTYVFGHIPNPKNKIPIVSDTPYNAVQILKGLAINLRDWELIRIIETTNVIRSIPAIEGDYQARQPKNK